MKEILVIYVHSLAMGDVQQEIGRGCSCHATNYPLSVHEGMTAFSKLKSCENCNVLRSKTLPVR